MIGQLTIHQLATLLCDNNLHVPNEYFVWRAIVNWIDCPEKQQSRIQYFWPLFGLVRWQLMHSTMINRNIMHEFVKLNQNYHNLLINDKKALKTSKNCYSQLDHQ